MAPDLSAFHGKRILITGGLGFIGSNLAHALAGHCAELTLVDSLIPQYGGNRFNISGIEDKVRVNIADVRDESSMDHLVRGQDFIFNLAGQVSHIDSMNDPYTDLEINCRSQLSILEACKKNNPGVKVLFAGTRGQYGKIERLPVDEDHPQRPTDVNGINKMAGEWYHILYHRVYGFRACSLRLTNTFGPRHHMRTSRQGVAELVHPPGARREGNPALRRRRAAARFQLRGRRSRGVPPRRGERSLERPGVQRRQRRGDFAARGGRTGRRDRRPRHDHRQAVPIRQGEDRDRQLPRGHHENPPSARLGAADPAARRRAPHGRVLPAA